MNVALLGPRHSSSPAAVPRPDRARLRPHLQAVRDVTAAPPDGSVRKVPAQLSNDTAGTAIVFGSFRLLPAQRLLLEGNKPVALGSRALEILIALVERHGELVSKNALMARVWPDTTVVEANLSVHIAALRRALRDGRDGSRYLVNMPGRGYRFVAPITLVEDSKPATSTEGGDDNIPELTEQAKQRRAARAGTGAIGKSVAASGSAEKQLDACRVWLIDFGPLIDPSEVARAVASLLGAQKRAAHPDLPSAFGHRRLVLMLDNSSRDTASAATLAPANQPA